METKYVLHIGEAVHELTAAELKNWGDIKCSFSRSDYGGVTRSFSSKFEFAGESYDLLLGAYLRDGFGADARIDVLTQNDAWGWDERFSCALDFSTIEWTGTVLSINAIDNTLAAKVKAAKSTKYEFAVGEGIAPDKTLWFDRIPMTETATYEIAGGESYDDCADLMVTLEKDELPYVGNVGSDISVGLSVEWNDDQTSEPGSYLFKALRDMTADMEYVLSYRTDEGGNSTNIGVGVRRKGQDIADAVETVASNKTDRAGFMGLPGRKANNYLGTFSTAGALKAQKPNPATGDWALVLEEVWAARYIGTGFEWYGTGQNREEYFTEEHIGVKRLTLKAGDEVYIYSNFPGPQDNAMFRIVRSCFKFSWRTIGDPVEMDVISPLTLLRSLMREIDPSANCVIDSSDPRMAGTYVIASESARAIESAKLYTSFSEFADWMETVFGYVYTIDGQTLRFLHRSDIFDPSADTFHIANVRDLRYCVDSSRIYSSVTIGYEKKDYDSINGRDEFNFSVTYATGCSVSDKKLTLTSKYRADSYGLEFAVQKRGADTTDSDADQTVFFALCKEEGGKLVPDRSLPLEGTLSDMVFNAAFSPAHCLRANAPIIGLQAKTLNLEYASATGNADVNIDSVPLKSAITLDAPIATCGIVELESDETGIEGHQRDVITFAHGGLTYSCYLSEVDICWARAEAAKYKLIVREVSL